MKNIVDRTESELLLEDKPVMRQGASQRWRTMILANACLAGSVCIINLTLTIIAVKNRSTDGLDSILSGDCQSVKAWNTAGHILINVLSTALLAASNYAMQCLSAPTRAEVDRAHERKAWVNIGILSARNWRYISRRRVWLVLILAVTSLPLHFW